MKVNKQHWLGSFDASRNLRKNNFKEFNTDF